MTTSELITLIDRLILEAKLTAATGKTAADHLNRLTGGIVSGRSI